MTPTPRALWLWGLASLLFVGALLEPALVAVGVGIDLVVLGLVVWDASRARAAPLQARRVLASTLHQAEPVELTVEIDNPDRRPWQLLVRDPLAPELGDPWSATLTVPPQSRVAPRRSLLPRRRGQVAVEGVWARVIGPLGLGAADLRLVEPSAARVLPQARFRGEEGIFYRHLLERRPGAHALRRAGVSTELESLREYRPGDDLRRVHWKQTARLRKPIVAETTREQHQSLVILLDAGRPMAGLAGDVTRLDRALAVMLGLLRLAVKERDLVSLVWFSREVRGVVRVDRAPSSWTSLYERLHDEAADVDEPDYLAPVAWCSRHVPRRSLVLVCTCVGDAVAADRLGVALRRLSHRHRAVLVDLQDTALAELARGTPTTEEDAYAKVAAMGVEARNAALQAELRRDGVDVVSTPAEGLLTGVLQAWLERRGA